MALGSAREEPLKLSSRKPGPVLRPRRGGLKAGNVEPPKCGTVLPANPVRSTARSPFQRRQTARRSPGFHRLRLDSVAHIARNPGQGLVDAAAVPRQFLRRARAAHREARARPSAT